MTDSDEYKELDFSEQTGKRSLAMVTLQVEEVLSESPTAMWLKIDDNEVCLPQSQIKGKGYNPKTTRLTVIEIPQWLAFDRGLI